MRGCSERHLAAREERDVVQAGPRDRERDHDDPERDERRERHRGEEQRRAQTQRVRNGCCHVVEADVPVTVNATTMIPSGTSAARAASAPWSRRLR